MQMYDLNNSPFAWVFDNMELYLYLACNSNGVSSNVTQSRSLSRQESTFTFLTNTLKTCLLPHPAILESTVVAFTSSYSNLSKAFLQSNNAGHYHDAFLLLSLPSIGECAGIRILRYNISHPQAGKDVCDRVI